MKKLVVRSLVFLLIFGLNGLVRAETKKNPTIFETSLHHNVRGMSYWYDKANGGLEMLTGVTFEQANCAKCHISSCDTCHKSENNGKSFYSIKASQDPEMCLKCHGRLASISKINKTAKMEDVHFARGMSCKDCHTNRELHGDGTEYVSMKQPGAMDVECAKCHKTVNPSRSHTVHGDKVDCMACHERHVLSCTNCHVETMLKEGKRVSLPAHGWLFLMNYKGKVTSANMQTFVAPGDKTFLIFAPSHSHSITKRGRLCSDCHGNENVMTVKKGKIRLTWLDGGKLSNLKGVIPVVPGVDYDLIYQNHKEGQWTPIKDAPKPILQYVGFGQPLSREQLNKLAKPAEKK